MRKEMAKKTKKKEISIEKMLMDLNEIIQEAESDSFKFDNGTNAAGARIRKVMQAVKVKAQEIRNAVTEVKNIRKE